MASDPNPPTAQPVQPGGVEPAVTAQAAGTPTNEEKQWAMFAHLSAIIAGFFGLAVPAVAGVGEDDDIRKLAVYAGEGLGGHPWPPPEGCRL